MKKVLCLFLLYGLLVPGVPGLAQSVPDLAPLVRDVTERQAQRLQEQAVERALRQAESAQTRVAERAQQQQAETVQNQVIEQVERQVERAQAQTVERAQNQIERVQGQIERTQGEVAERVGAAGTRLETLPADAGAPVRGADAAGGLVAATDDEAGRVPDPPDRRPVLDDDGNTVFVEVSIEPGVRAVEFEWVMLVSPAERQQLNDEATELLRLLDGAQPFPLTDGELLSFRVPPDLDANDAILQLVPENLRDRIDRNHLYFAQEADVAALPTGTAGHGIPVLALPMAAVCEEPLALGMIDSGIDTGHAAFDRHTRFRSRNFVEAPLVPAVAHGTATASLLVGTQPGEAGASTLMEVLRPLLPQATIYSAAVFHALEDAAQGATVMRVLAALDWLVAQDDVQVINMSLTGPPNRLLEQALVAAASRDKMVVAAAGNEGPHGPLRYPAAYDSVIGATAVDRHGAIFRWANQGPHIDYAGLGVDVPVAQAGAGFGLASGTSMAAPVVAAFVACALLEQPEPDAALASLQARVMDLGVPGSDPVFGKGLLHP